LGFLKPPFNDAILPLGAAYWAALVKQQLPVA
jgi:amidohydrolase/hippurate hydrolase